MPRLILKILLHAYQVKAGELARLRTTMEVDDTDRAEMRRLVQEIQTLEDFIVGSYGD